MGWSRSRLSSPRWTPGFRCVRMAVDAAGYFREGIAFSPMYTLGIKKTVQGKGELRTWLKVAKAS